MKGIYLIGIAAVVFIVAYLVYGRYLVKTWGIDIHKKTPAQEINDGDDYVEADKFTVFAHQFSSIAGAGPVTGPILAAMFGWLPAFLWIIVGGIFFGAVQDFGALYASVKNKGKSMGDMIEMYIGKAGRKLFLCFSWIFTLLVIAAFSDMVVNTFNGFDTQGVQLQPSAAAGSISILFIFVAMAFGVFLKKVKISGGKKFALGIVLFVVTLAIGIKFPLYLGKDGWTLIVFIYAFIAALMPMWLLMQPRDYLNSFLMIGMIVAAVIGIVVANPTIQLDAFKGFSVSGKDIFPALFITIACGAVSGFHSLVSSNSSSKQVANEKDMLMVGYGSMLLESLLAVVALVIVGALSIGGTMPEGTPFSIFSQGVGSFLTMLNVPTDISICIITMFLSALALTTLDSVSRIGRGSFQELFEDNGSKINSFMRNKYVATIITLGAGYLLSRGGYQNIWPLFGAANQLLSALVLIALSVFLKATNRKGFMLWVPMGIMLCVTLTALGQSVLQIVGKLIEGQEFIIMIDGLQLVFAIALIVLGVLVAFSGGEKLLRRKEKTTPLKAATTK